MLFVLGFIQRVQRHQVYALLGLAAVSVVGGGLAFSFTQKISVGAGLYWAVTTAATVGYGDITPHRGIGRVIAVLEMLTAIPLFAGVFATVTATVTSLQLKNLLLGLERRVPDQAFVAIYGNHTIVPSVARELISSGARVLVVAEDIDQQAFPEGTHIVSGDPTSEDVIRRSAPERALRALVAMENEGDSLVTVVLLRHVAPELAVTAVVHSAHVARALEDLGVEQALSAEELVGHVVAMSLEAPYAADLMRNLLDSNRYRLREIDLPPELAGLTVSAARAQHGDLVLAIVHNGEVIMGVNNDPTLSAGDRMLVLCPSDGSRHHGHSARAAAAAAPVPAAAPSQDRPA
jgi:voltage-gated potassium channel